MDPSKDHKRALRKYMELLGELTSGQEFSPEFCSYLNSHRLDTLTMTEACVALGLTDSGDIPAFLYATTKSSAATSAPNPMFDVLFRTVMSFDEHTFPKEWSFFRPHLLHAVVDGLENDYAPQVSGFLASLSTKRTVMSPEGVTVADIEAAFSPINKLNPLLLRLFSAFPLLPHASLADDPADPDPAHQRAAASAEDLLGALVRLGAVCESIASSLVSAATEVIRAMNAEILASSDGVCDDYACNETYRRWKEVHVAVVRHVSTLYPALTLPMTTTSDALALLCVPAHPSTDESTQPTDAAVQTLQQRRAAELLGCYAVSALSAAVAGAQAMGVGAPGRVRGYLDADKEGQGKEKDAEVELPDWFRESAAAEGIACDDDGGRADAAAWFTNARSAAALMRSALPPLNTLAAFLPEPSREAVARTVLVKSLCSDGNSGLSEARAVARHTCKGAGYLHDDGCPWVAHATPAAATVIESLDRLIAVGTEMLPWHGQLGSSSFTGGRELGLNEDAEGRQYRLDRLKPYLAYEERYGEERIGNVLCQDGPYATLPRLRTMVTLLSVSIVALCHDLLVSPPNSCPKKYGFVDFAATLRLSANALFFDFAYGSQQAQYHLSSLPYADARWGLASALLAPLVEVARKQGRWVAVAAALGARSSDDSSTERGWDGVLSLCSASAAGLAAKAAKARLHREALRTGQAPTADLACEAKESVLTTHRAEAADCVHMLGRFHACLLSHDEVDSVLVSNPPTIAAVKALAARGVDLKKNSPADVLCEYVARKLRRTEFECGVTVAPRLNGWTDFVNGVSKRWQD